MGEDGWWGWASGVRSTEDEVARRWLRYWDCGWRGFQVAGLGKRMDRRVMKRMTGVSHDSAPLPPPPVSVCQGHEPPLAAATAAFSPTFIYLFIFALFPCPSSSSSFLKKTFLRVFMCLSDEQLLYDCWLASTHPRAATWSVKRRRWILECGEF